jgi:hypothetical protein
MKRATLLLLSMILLSGAASATPEGWHKSLDDGLKAARRSGKAVLVVTAWAPEI